jgi:hypothetical protein
MTDEERQEIVRNLRNYHPSRVGNWTFTRAADELERLAAEVKELERNGPWGISHYSWPEDASRTGWFRLNERFRDD